MAFLALLLAVLLLPRHRTVPSAAFPPSPASSPPAIAGFSENAAAASAPSLHPAEGPRGLPCVVTLASAPTPADRAAIAATGARIRAYLPENAYLVEAAPAARATLTALPRVAALSEFSPSAKIAPDLLADTASLPPDAPLPLSIVTFDPADAPALADALTALGAASVRLSVSSRRALATAVLPAARALRPADWPFVQWLERRRPRVPFNDLARLPGSLDTAPLDSLPVPLDGAGQIVAVADSGLGTGGDASAPAQAVPHPDLADRLLAVHEWARTNDWSDPSGHGTHVAGSLLGTGAASTNLYRGIAPAASLVFQCVGDASGAFSGLPDDLRDLFAQADAAGAAVHSHSWGTPLDSAYDVDSLSADEFAYDHPASLLVFAAGNAGVDRSSDGRIARRTLATPATAKNVLTVGAAESGRPAGSGGHTADTWADAYSFPTPPISTDLVSTPPPGAPPGLAAFSSRGPTSDGRVKPDLVAPGTDVLSLRSAAADSPGDAPHPANTNYCYMSGTSMATPLVSGLALLLRQHLLLADPAAPPPRSDLLKAALIGGARSLSPGQYGTGWSREIPAARPNPVEGFGIPDLAATIAPTAPLVPHYFQLPPTLETGGEFLLPFDVLAPDLPLAAVLVWIDPPPALSSSKRLVNDLDLELLAPDGTAHRPDSAPNRRDNVEAVYLPFAPAGRWTLRVAAHSVPLGPQSFALYLRAAAAPALTLAHAPLPDTPDPDVPRPVTAAVAPAAPLAAPRTLTLAYAAELPDGTSDAATLPMAADPDTAAYAATLPAFPVGTLVRYRIDSSDALASPADPAAYHSYRVVPPATVAVSLDGPALPDPLPADPSPPVGTNTLPSDTPLTFTAPDLLLAPDTPFVRHLCTGWTATAPLPPAGTANTFAATLSASGAPSLVWHYALQNALTVVTDPPFLVPAQTLWVTAPAATVSNLPAVPEQIQTTNGPYRFAGWTLDGAPLAPPHPNPLPSIPWTDAPATLAARYLPASLDADANGLSDAFELRHFGTLGQNPFADPDSDGAENALEDADGSSPLDPTSLPAPPAVALFPIPTPLTNAFPLEIAVAAADPSGIASVTLQATRNTAAPRTLPCAQDPGDPDRWTAALPLPAADGDAFTLVATAVDNAGLTAASAPLAFTVAWPRLLAPSNTGPAAVLSAAPRPAAPATVSLAFANAGTAPLHLAASLLPLGLRDDFETGAPGWHATPGSTWHLSARAAHSPTNAFYNGYSAENPVYPPSTDASLYAPPVRLPPPAAADYEPTRLAFHHLADFEPDLTAPDATPARYWDSARLEAALSTSPTNYLLLTPTTGYPATIVSNPASPFPPDSPCLANAADWTRLDFPLPLAPDLPSTPTLTVRFRFGSDAYDAGSGWTLDDVEITPRTRFAAPETNTNWAALSATNLTLPPATDATLAVTLDATFIPPAAADWQWLAITHNDPTLPTPLCWLLRVENPTRLLTADASGPGTNAPSAILLDDPSSAATFTYAPATSTALLADLTATPAAATPPFPETYRTGGTVNIAFPSTNLHLHFHFAAPPPPDAIPPASWLAAHTLTNAPPDALSVRDPDADGLLVWQEYALSLDPLIPDAELRLLPDPTSPNRLRWHAFTNENLHYTLETTPSLTTPTYTPVLTLPAAPPLMTSPPLSPTTSPAFYRLSIP